MPAPPGFAGILKEAYEAFRDVLQMEDVAFGTPETPLGARQEDPKRYLEFGLEDRADIPLALRNLRKALCDVFEERMGELQGALLPRHGPTLASLVDRSRGPVLRFSYYPAGFPGEVNQPHTDIDLITILPAATRPGLEIRSGVGWVRTDPDTSELLVVAGDIIQHFGGPPPVEHRVVTDGLERISASLFVNAEPSLRVGGNHRVGDLFDRRLAELRWPGGQDKG